MTARHRDVADTLRLRIVRGVLPVGSPLPTEAELGAEFSVSRGTIRHALAALRWEVLCGGGRGAPPVVRSDIVAQPFETLQSFSAWALAAGHAPGQRTVEVARRSPSPHVAAALDLGPGDRVVDVVRLRLLDDRPTMVERASFVDDVGRHLLSADLDAGSIHALLAGREVDLAASCHTLDAVAADPLDGDLLGVAPGSPLLRERRLVSDGAGRPLELSDDRYRPGTVAFTSHNARGRAGTTAATLRRAPAPGTG